MGFFDRFSKSEVGKARKEAERNPNPITLEAYCRALIAHQDLDGALQQAQEGLERFPDAERLLSVVKYVKKNQLGPQVVELKEKVRTNPSPMLYRQLAELYRDIGDDQRALDTCMEVRERYPKDENTHLVMGEIYHDRYQKSYLASDGLQAVENLQRACQLNRNNYNALLKMAQLYISIGRFKDAVPYLRNVINFAASDRKAKTLLTKSIESSESESDLDDVDTLFRQVEERRRPFYKVVHKEDGDARIEALIGSGTKQKDERGVMSEVDAFDLGTTFSAIIAFDKNVKPITSHMRGTSAEKQGVVDAVQTMLDTIVKQAPSLAMGSFREGVLESPDLGMHIISFAGGYIYLASKPDARPEQIDQMIGDLIGRVTA